jgi:hypothetical protein
MRKFQYPDNVALKSFAKRVNDSLQTYTSSSDYIKVHREMLKLCQFSRHDHHSARMMASTPGE